MPKLIMFIGIPGSGKSTAAKKYQELHNPHPKIYEADMFFVNDKGEYNWNPHLLPMAHQWCLGKVALEMASGNDVIVSNTNLTPKERKPYFKLAKEFGYEIEVIECNGGYQNIHNVPDETIKRMKEKFIPFSKDELNF